MDIFHTDIQKLIFYLRNAYIGSVVIDKSVFDDVIMDLTNLLQKDLYNFDKAELCLDIGKILSQLPDNHIRCVYGNLYFKPSKIRLDIGNNLNDTEKGWKGYYDGDIGIVAITHFPSGIWSGFKEFIYDLVKNSKNVIIDLRDNIGGNDEHGEILANTLAGQQVTSVYEYIMKSKSRYNIELWKNGLKNMLKYSTTDEERLGIHQLIAKTDKLLESNKFETHEIYYKNFESSSDLDFDQSKVYKGNIYILQNKKTASSAENTIEKFEQFENVIKIGTNTGGYLQFGNIGLLHLDYLDFDIYLPTHYLKYKDDRKVEKIGIKPDIELTDGQDAYEYTKELILSAG